MWRVENPFEVCDYDSKISLHIGELFPVVPNGSSVGATQHMQTTGRCNFPRVGALLGE